MGPLKIMTLNANLTSNCNSRNSCAREMLTFSICFQLYVTGWQYPIQDKASTCTIEVPMADRSTKEIMCGSSRLQSPLAVAKSSTIPGKGRL